MKDSDQKEKNFLQRYDPKKSNPNKKTKTIFSIDKNYFRQKIIGTCQIPKEKREKYVSKKILSFTYQNKKQLEEQQIYDLNNGKLPDFLSWFLHFDYDKSVNLKIALHNPKLFRWNKKGNFVLFPNPTYVDNIEQFTRHPKIVKYNSKGFGLIGWFIHPELLKGTFFETQENRDSTKRFRSHLLKKIQEIHRAKRQSLKFQSFSNKKEEKPFIEYEKLKPSFLVTILDLNKSHISILKEFHQIIKEHLRMVYGITKSDFVRIYIHYPYSPQTVTLHIHIRINQATPQLDLARSFELCNVIKELERGKTGIDLVWERQMITNGILNNLETEETLPLQTSKVSIQTINNPFINDDYI
ncbi:histidine triad hit protein member [Anaeramoeba flamelloides]|uniref:Histidine triad hit protein member n=1 Tax=Anaeramoeba flamelloides TaxID=1746091 RepID=A0AAV8AC92_9EUKA|nr:histidine triad hit protein member [Anaeramoeba flamelloides]